VTTDRSYSSEAGVSGGRAETLAYASREQRDDLPVRCSPRASGSHARGACRDSLDLKPPGLLSSRRRNRRRSFCRESQDSSAHRSRCVPLDPTSVNVKSGVDVYVTRPTYNVVDGPAGKSVGNKISTQWPVSDVVHDPSGL
jgi:hypothetical protein